MNCKLTTLLAAVALGAISQAAFAADLPARPVYREAAVVPVVANWTGFYVGAGGGYGMYNADTSTAGVGTGVHSHPTMDGLAGEAGSALCRSAPTTSGAVGLPAYLPITMFSSIKGTIGELSGPGLVPFKQNSAWAAGGRIGYLVVPTASFVLQRWLYQCTVRRRRGNLNGGAFSGVTWPDQNFSGYFLGSGTEYHDCPRLVREDRVPLFELQFENNRTVPLVRPRLRY